MRSPKGGRLLTMEKAMPCVSRRDTAARLRSVSTLSVVTRVPSTSEMTSEIPLMVPRRKHEGRALYHPCASFLDHVYATRAADHDFRSQANKEATLDNADHRREPGFQGRRVGYFGDGAVGDAIAAIGREGLGCGKAQPRRAADRRQAIEDGLPAERDDLHRQR